MAKLYFEDFSVGGVAEYGDTLVTAEEIKAFAAEFDPQPMHLDEEAAKKTIVGGLCASGWHTCCLMMRIVVDGFICSILRRWARRASRKSAGWRRCGPATGCACAPLSSRTREPKSRPDFGFVRMKFEVLNATARRHARRPPA